MSQKQIKVRNSSIELLRIIAMLMIVIHHFAIHGGFDWDASSISISRLWYNFILMGGKAGVNIFVLISGYYLIENHGDIFNLGKIAKFLSQVLFYSVVIFAVYGLSGAGNVGVISLIKACFPITFSQWWFVSAYFLLYLIHPFLNKLLQNIDQTLYQKLLLLLVICWSIIPTFTTSPYESNALLWFVTLYTIAGYIKLYGLNPKLTSKHYFAGFLLFSFLTYASSVVFSILGKNWGIFASHATYFYGQQKLPTLLISLSLFMTFATLTIQYRKWINTIASTTFGVYLFHDHGITRQFLWMDIFKNAQYQNSMFLIPFSIVVALVVFGAGVLIDLTRQHVVEKPFMKIVNHFSNKQIKPFESFCMYLRNFIFGK